MSLLTEAKYDICRNYRLDKILRTVGDLDEQKRDLFEYFYGEFCDADIMLLDEDSPTVVGLREDISEMEMEIVDLNLKIKQLEEINRSKGRN